MKTQDMAVGSEQQLRQESPAPRAERQAGSDAARASRRFEFTVQNGIGDEATVTINVREDRSPNSYVGFAIANAMRRLPQNRPFRVTSINEVRS